MNRHVLSVVLRILYCIGVAVALPVAHSYFGEQCPWEGPTCFGILVTLSAYGLIASVVVFIIGSIAQYALRRRDANVVLVVDLTLAILVVVILTIVGVAVHY